MTPNFNQYDLINELDVDIQSVNLDEEGSTTGEVRVTLYSFTYNPTVHTNTLRAEWRKNRE